MHQARTLSDGHYNVWRMDFIHEMLAELRHKSHVGSAYI